MARLKECPCGSGHFPTPLQDGHGIFLCYACISCMHEKLKGYRPDIMERYDTDEQIEED
jgi:hypothetical protein